MGIALNRRVIYNRASADPMGKPWDPKRQILEWDGSKWTGMDIPDYSNAAPGSGVRPVYHATGRYGAFIRTG